MYQPQFVISNTILKNIGSIEACKEIIDHAPLLPYYEKEFRKDALVRTIHHGTHIEGNELDLSQAEQVMAGEEIVARDRDIQEVINYRKVIDFLNKVQDEKTINEETILEIHAITVDKILDETNQGKYRKNQVVIKNNQTGDVSFRPIPPQEVEKAVKELLEFVNTSSKDSMHPVLKSGAVHYEFVRIHPFVDGNGRVARALSTLILFLEDYDIRKFFSLEEYFDSNAEEYYAALQSVEKESGDLTKWLEYFTKGLAIELTKIKRKVESISIDAKIREKLGNKPLLLTDRQLKIIEYIQKIGYLQNQAFKSLFPFVSEDTILNELKPLVEAGIIRKQGVTKGAKYIIG